MDVKANTDTEVFLSGYSFIIKYMKYLFTFWKYFASQFSLKTSLLWPDNQNVLREYITCVDNLPIYHLDKVQCYWPRKPNILSLLDFGLAPLSTTLKFDRNPVTGELGEMHEVPVTSAGENAQNSMSMTRAPGPARNSIRGKQYIKPYVKKY